MQARKHPNFLIVGAAKAGTTSIAKYLEEHPEVFMAEEKEPFYFLRESVANLPKDDLMRDIIRKKLHADATSYYGMFDEVKDEKRSGEATVHYLYHYDEVIPKVRDELGDVPIIIVLRDPSRRAFSNYTYQKRIEFGSFEEALKNEETKKSKGWNSFWYYRDQGNYYLAVKAYLENFSSVHVCFFEDLKENPSRFMSEMYSFLEVDKNFTPNVETRHNQTVVPKNRFIKWLYYLKIKYKIRLGLPKAVKKNLLSASIKQETEVINEQTLKELRVYYKPNIKKLEMLLSKDLSKWYD